MLLACRHNSTDEVGKQPTCHPDFSCTSLRCQKYGSQEKSGYITLRISNLIGRGLPCHGSRCRFESDLIRGLG